MQLYEGGLRGAINRHTTIIASSSTDKIEQWAALGPIGRSVMAVRLRYFWTNVGLIPWRLTKDITLSSLR
jgi:hypothetical protein